MCGRTALTSTREDLRDAFGLSSLPDIDPHYNIAPSQAVAVVRAAGRLELLPWGLVPFWAGDTKIGHKLALARAETIDTARPFRDAVRRRRCLVVVSGFYEWQRAGAIAATPFFIRRADSKPFALAGVWERWASKNGDVIESCAIVTHAARPPFDAVHHRMPVVLEAAAWTSWLDAMDVGDVAPLLAPRAADLEFFPVSAYVNDPRHDDARCLLATEPAQRSLF